MAIMSCMTSSYHNQELDVGLGIYHYSCVLTQHTVYAVSNCQPHKPGDGKTTNCHCPPWQPSTGSRHNPLHSATKPSRHSDTSVCWYHCSYCCCFHHRGSCVQAEISESTAINSFFCNAEFGPAVGEPHVYCV